MFNKGNITNYYKRMGYIEIFISTHKGNWLASITDEYRIMAVIRGNLFTAIIFIFESDNRIHVQFESH